MKLIYTFIFILLLSACGGDKVYTPKPRMYPRVMYPEKTYEVKEMDYCDFSFRVPSYMKVIQDQYFYDDKVIDPCWFDLKVRELNATLHCSYYPVTSQKALDTLINDAFKVTNKHNIKANYIEEALVYNPKDRVYGLVFDVDGPVASPVQFYLTDSTHHFFRASLYFDSKVNPDSTAPVLKFLHQDIDTLISTWRWTTKS